MQELFLTAGHEQNQREKAREIAHVQNSLLGAKTGNQQRASPVLETSSHHRGTPAWFQRWHGPPRLSDFLSEVVIERVAPAAAEENGRA